MRRKKSEKDNSHEHKNITIRDIAREAGVSPGTVSRIFHSPHMVKQSTKDRINSVISKHNYIPNMYASALTTKQTMTIGLIIPTVQNSIHAALIESIQEQCNREGYSVLIGNTNYSYETETKLLEIMLRRRVSGILHAGTLNNDSLNILRMAAEHKIPSVVVWENIDDKEISSIGIDNYAAGYAITNYLVERGHREIGVLIGPYNRMTRLKQRLLGYRQCLIDNNIEHKTQNEVKIEHKISEGAEGLKHLLKYGTKLTAIFAASDVLAFGALHQAHQEGIRVPKDLSIVGFDDIEFASYCAPPLTTIRVPGIEMGKTAVEELIDRIDNKRVTSKHICLKTEIVERQSVKKLN